MHHIVAFVGTKGTGKSTCEQMMKEQLEQRGYNVFRIAFADSLKDFCSNVSAPINDVTKKDAFYKHGVKDSDCLITSNKNGNHKLKSPREFMEKVGKTVREFDSDAFINAVDDKILELIAYDPDCYIIIDDVRHENELKYLEMIGSTIVFLNWRPEKTIERVMRKISISENNPEQGLYHLFDRFAHFAIDNDKSMGYNYLRSKIKALVDSDFCHELFYLENKHV